MATAISSLPNEVSKNQVVSMVEKNTEAAVNMKIANPPKQEPIMAPNAPTELSQQSINQIVAGLQQAQGATGLPSRDLPTNSGHITQDEQIQPNYIPKPENTNYIENDHSNIFNLNNNEISKSYIYYFLYSIIYINKRYSTNFILKTTRNLKH